MSELEGKVVEVINMECVLLCLCMSGETAFHICIFTLDLIGMNHDHKSLSMRERICNHGA